MYYNVYAMSTVIVINVNFVIALTIVKIITANLSGIFTIIVIIVRVAIGIVTVKAAVGKRETCGRRRQVAEDARS